MFYVLAVLIGFGAGFLASYLALETRRRAYVADKTKLDTDAALLNEAKIKLESETASVRKEVTEFEKRVASAKRLEQENQQLKRDLRNIALQTRKQAMDCQQQETRSNQIEADSNSLARRYLNDSLTWISKSITPNNFTISKKRLLDSIAACRKIGFAITESEQETYLADLQREFEKAVRAAFEREEQARIKAQIREEGRREKEIQNELDRLERERQAIEAALAKARADVERDHSAEIEALTQRLAEAEENSKRAMSQAQLTKSGHVYVISNIGSFGEGVFKIGMTRRLEPLFRVKELGDASVPFPFDVHMMISTNNAPELENALHRELHRCRVNRVNPRKEFFRSDLNRIVAFVKSHHGEVEYVADAEALEYRQSLEATEDDQAYIERVYEDAGFGDDDEE